jgi:hypothetical protein
MDIIATVFSYYDQILSPLPIATQALISFIFLALLVWQIFMIIKSGHWIFIVALIIFLPGTWPAVKQLGYYAWMIIKFFITRAQLLV